MDPARTFRDNALRTRRSNRRRLWVLLGGFLIITVFLVSYHHEDGPFMRFWSNGLPQKKRPVRLVSKPVEVAAPALPNKYTGAQGHSQLHQLKNAQAHATSEGDMTHSNRDSATMSKATSDTTSQSLASSCDNSMVGPHLVVDDNGFVCAREHLDFHRKGCCMVGHDPQHRPYSERYGGVKHCKLDKKCCDTYEHCVALCQDPVHRTILDNLSKKVTSPHFSSTITTFEFCQAQCRTSSKSTEHENTYKSSYHFCINNAPH